jgi:uncharacterized membrane protein YhhN
VFWVLIAAGLAGAIAYGLFFLDKGPSWPRALIKTLFMGAFAAAFAQAGGQPLLLLALAGSAVGDFFLAFDKKWILPLGILAFLIAQLSYLALFYGAGASAAGLAPVWPRYAAVAVIVAAALGFLIWMGPKLGKMAFAVIPYSIAITAMACAAMRLPWPAWPSMIGVVSFLTSDFVLAAELFRLDADAPVRRVTAPVVWWTYVAAQVLIVAGVMQLQP